jgi:tRNA pseudouridine38-40 synthase
VAFQGQLLIASGGKMKRIKAVLEYDGSGYHGFQIQKNAISIQETIESSIEKLIGYRVSIMAAGRTDAGVHALGQVIAFDTNSSIPADKWKFALNSILPADIRVISSCRVDSDFHPRFQALDKKYIYYIYRRQRGRVFYSPYAYCNQEKLNMEAMQEACKLLLGLQNFKSFCASGSSVKTFDRHIKECQLSQKGPFIQFEICADGFLYHMVRIIVGTLLEVGRSNLEPQDIARIIQAQDRNQAGPTAPPQGLYLHSVNYGM